MIAWTFLPDWPPSGVLLLLAAALNMARLQAGAVWQRSRNPCC